MPRRPGGSWYRRGGKRLFDLAVATPLLLLLAPLLAGLAAAIRLDSRGPILLRQRRAGLAGRPFHLYKLRTMVDRPRPLAGEVLTDHPEVTRLGRWLRRFKLDELPQLVNVLVGQMSLVGPRPALPEQAERYDELARRRLCVRPGLTGLSQVRGNIHLPWPERWRHDAEYVDSVSLTVDLKILLRTIAVVLLGEGRALGRPGDAEGP